MTNTDNQTAVPFPPQESAPELDEQALEDITGAGGVFSTAGKKLTQCVSSVMPCTNKKVTPLLRRSNTTGSIAESTTSTEAPRSVKVNRYDINAIGDVYKQAFGKNLHPGDELYKGL